MNKMQQRFLDVLKEEEIDLIYKLITALEVSTAPKLNFIKADYETVLNMSSEEYKEQLIKWNLERYEQGRLRSKAEKIALECAWVSTAHDYVNGVYNAKKNIARFEADPNNYWETNYIDDEKIFPDVSRGSLLRHYVPVKGFVVSEYSVGDTVKLRRGYKVKEGVITHLLEYEGVAKLSTGDIIASYKNMNNAYDALFMCNRYLVFGWWNRAFTIL